MSAVNSSSTNRLTDKTDTTDNPSIVLQPQLESNCSAPQTQWVVGSESAFLEVSSARIRPTFKSNFATMYVSRKRGFGHCGSSDPRLDAERAILSPANVTL